MSLLRETWSLDECTQIFYLPQQTVGHRRIRGWFDEPGLVPGITEYRAEAGHSAERCVNRQGLITLALLVHLSAKVGEKAPMIREIIRAVPASAIRALDGVDLEHAPAENVIFRTEDDDEITIRPKFFRRLVASRGVPGARGNRGRR